MVYLYLQWTFPYVKIGDFIKSETEDEMSFHL